MRPQDLRKQQPKKALFAPLLAVLRSPDRSAANECRVYPVRPGQHRSWDVVRLRAEAGAGSRRSCRFGDKLGPDQLPSFHRWHPASTLFGRLRSPAKPAPCSSTALRLSRLVWLTVVEGKAPDDTYRAPVPGYLAIGRRRQHFLTP